MMRFSFLVLVLFISCGFLKEGTTNTDLNLVQSNTWFIAGPAKETQETLNTVREKDGIIRVTAQDSPVGEIELNVLIKASDSNDGPSVNLSDKSKFVSITYKSTQLIKLQAREGNEEGTGCVHGRIAPES